MQQMNGGTTDNAIFSYAISSRLGAGVPKKNPVDRPRPGTRFAGEGTAPACQPLKRLHMLDTSPHFAQQADCEVIGALRNPCRIINKRLNTGWQALDDATDGRP